MIGLPIKREQMIINSEKRKLHHDYSIITNLTSKSFLF